MLRERPPKRSESGQVFSVWIQEDLADRLKQIRAANNTTYVEIFRHMCEQSLDRLFDINGEIVYDPWFLGDPDEEE